MPPPEKTTSTAIVKVTGDPTAAPLIAPTVKVSTNEHRSITWNFSDVWDDLQEEGTLRLIFLSWYKIVHDGATNLLPFEEFVHTERIEEYDEGLTDELILPGFLDDHVADDVTLDVEYVVFLPQHDTSVLGASSPPKLLLGT